jgi:RimJ/RimL family protein N-acetyltransferase
MLRGELTALRARAGGDAEILHAELYEDVAEWIRGSHRPWTPVPFGSRSEYAVPEDDRKAEPDRSTAEFSIVELMSGDLAGSCVLWGIDTHNRYAHIGIELRPGYRGRGLGLDAVRVVCRYGFSILGLRRLQLETLADNHAMIAVAEKAGFTREGTLRQASWVNGVFLDDVVFGLLSEEFGG